MILLTGGTGFIGKYILQELLDASYPVRLLVREAQSRDLPKHPGVEIIEGDILDILALEAAMEGVDYVIHAAAHVSFAKQDRALMKEVNISGTANVVDAALTTGIKKLVHISSTSATGRAGRGEWVDEEKKWQDKEKHTAYGRSKRAAELEVYRGIAEGLSAVILNPAIVLGVGDWEKNTPKIFSTLYKGLAFYNHGIGGYVAAKDVAKAARLALESDFEAGDRFILAAENLNQKDFFTQVAHALGKKAPRYRFPAFLTLPLGLASEWIAKVQGKTPIITRETMARVNSQTFYHGEKALKLGLTYTPINEVVAEVAAAFLAEHQ